MKILTVVGARPQFIKAAAISRVIRDQYTSSIEEIIVHTGQHHDENISQIFFDELDIPKPKFNLEISGGSHGAMTGKMLEGIERVLLHENIGISIESCLNDQCPLCLDLKLSG